MAVEAQYSSNVFLLNRGIQEGKNQLGDVFAMQAQQGGGGGGTFLDQPRFIFNHNTPPVNDNRTNQRKRGREINSIFSSPSMHQQQPHFQEPQLIDLTQLHTPPQNTAVSTGLRLSFGDHLQSQSLSLLTQDFAAQMKHQRDEIDQFLQAQGDQLRRTLAEKRQRHYHALLATAEEAVAKKIREKEAEVEKAVRRNAELQARAAHFSAEAQVWQARASAQEATAATLQAQLQNAMMRQGCAQNHDGTLTCASGEVAADDAESAYIDPERVEVTSGPSCKACQKRVASVVLLPCRHLSVCTECDGVVQSCPLCLSFRSSSVEVFLG